jgi:hypothetical protein
MCHEKHCPPPAQSRDCIEDVALRGGIEAARWLVEQKDRLPSHQRAR